MFKMCCLLVVCSLIVFVNAAALDQESEAKIINNEYTIDEKGNYKFSFRTSNGITREEIGSIINEGLPNQYIEVYGSYAYLNTEGKEEIVKYTAGDQGYIILPPHKPVTPIIASPPVVASLLGK